MRDPVIMNRQTRWTNSSRTRQMSLSPVCEAGKNLTVRHAHKGGEEPDCHTCAKNFGPPGECTYLFERDGLEKTVTCVKPTLDLLDDVISAWEGGAGENCSECDCQLLNLLDTVDQMYLRGWAGDNCTDLWCLTLGQLDNVITCLRLDGLENNCSECAANFGPAGKCDQCLLLRMGWRELQWLCC